MSLDLTRRSCFTIRVSNTVAYHYASCRQIAFSTILAACNLLLLYDLCYDELLQHSSANAWTVLAWVSSAYSFNIRLGKTAYTYLCCLNATCHKVAPCGPSLSKGIISLNTSNFVKFACDSMLGHPMNVVRNFPTIFGPRISCLWLSTAQPPLIP
jgi:hypothetical protein